MAIKCYAAFEAKAELRPHRYEPGSLGPFEVEIAITHCGLCHSDIHLIDDDWHISTYPLVPGHEIVGTVRQRGSAVAHLSLGQRVGVGWQCGSCLACEWCLRGEETCCSDKQPTCVGRPGGFANAVRVDSRFAHPIPDALASEHAAPLLCAGITVYTPLKSGVKPTSRVGVIGVGGLGHLALQFAAAFGCEVTAFSTTPAKEEEARRLGARHFAASGDMQQLESLAGSLDFLLSTVTAPLDWSMWLNVLRPQGTLWVVGASPGKLDIPPMALIVGNKTIRGSGIGTRATMQEMLEFAARHGIRAQTEVMPMLMVNAAVRHVRENRARYRVVLMN
jgi:uncharacterized zinc-type alcohol dehydrogenase-like protein